MTRRAAPDRLPTLTEVVPWPEPAAAAPPGEAQSDAAPDQAQLAQRVLAEVQRQAETVLEQRLREALGPVLARVGERMVQEARDELASALREIVERVVAQELERRRQS